MEILTNTIQMVLFVLAMGLVVVTTHNTWSIAFNVAITVLGWIMIIKSVLYLVFTLIIKAFRVWSDETMGTSVKGGVVHTPPGTILVYQNTIIA